MVSLASNWLELYVHFTVKMHTSLRLLILDFDRQFELLISVSLQLFRCFIYPGDVNIAYLHFC